MNQDFIQAEIEKALEQLWGKSSFTEAILAKKIRENNKMEGKRKAGIGLNDLLAAVAALEEKQFFYSVHINSVNEILLKKEDCHKDFDLEAKRRRQRSEKSMSILTSGDLQAGGGKVCSGKAGGGKALDGKNQKKKVKKSAKFYDDFEDFE